MRPILTLICVLCALSCSMACGQIEPEPILNTEGKPIEFPPQGEQWLQVESITPVPDQNLLSSSPTFRITFNQYLQEDTAISYGVVSLRTGARGASGVYDPIMVDRALLWRPYNPLRDGYEYTLKADGNGLYSVTGAPTPPMYSRSVTFRVDAMLAPKADSELPVEEVAWPRVREIFTQRGCYTCHGEPSWNRLNALSYSSLVSTKAADVDLFLVRFKDPTNSYLMHKILPDYPVLRGTRQPPPWRDDLRALSREEIWIVEQWIRQGVRESM